MNTKLSACSLVLICPKKSARAQMCSDSCGRLAQLKGAQPSSFSCFTLSSKQEAFSAGTAKCSSFLWVGGLLFLQFSPKKLQGLDFGPYVSAFWICAGAGLDKKGRWVVKCFCTDTSMCKSIATKGKYPEFSEPETLFPYALPMLLLGRWLGWLEGLLCFQCWGACCTRLDLSNIDALISMVGFKRIQAGMTQQ